MKRRVKNSILKYSNISWHDSLAYFWLNWKPEPGKIWKIQFFRFIVSESGDGYRIGKDLNITAIFLQYLYNISAIYIQYLCNICNIYAINFLSDIYAIFMQLCNIYAILNTT